MPYQPGPFNGEHFYLQWGGTLPGGDEWSCGLRMAPTPDHLDVPLANDAGWTSTTAMAVQAFHATAASMISPRAILTYSKFNVITVDGHYKDQVTQEHVFPNVPGGGNAGFTPANQIALAVSLTTGFARGPAHRGRFYMPLPTMMVGTTGTIAAADRDTIKDSVQHNLIDALNAVTPNLAVAVMSRKLASPGSHFVTGVEIGVVLDTQRRRRNKLKEAY